MADECVKGGGQPAQQRVVPAVAGEGDRDRTDRFGVSPVDDGPLVAAEGPDAIAGPQKREVRADHLFEHFSQVCLDPPLHRRFRFLWVAGCERPAAQEDPRPVPQVNAAQRPLLQPVPAQLTLTQPGAGQERLVLVIRGGIISTDSQQQERLHKITLVSAGHWLSQSANPAAPACTGSG